MSDVAQAEARLGCYGQILAELKEIRKYNGVTVEKLATEAPAFLRHEAVALAMQKRGLSEAERPVAALGVLGCFARSGHWSDDARMILVDTLNLSRKTGSLSSRRADITEELGLSSKTFTRREEETYEALAAYIINENRSPCDNPLPPSSEAIVQMAVSALIMSLGGGDVAEGRREFERILEFKIPRAMAAFSFESERDKYSEVPRYVRAIKRIVFAITKSGLYTRTLISLRQQGVINENFVVLSEEHAWRAIGIYARSANGLPVVRAAHSARKGWLVPRTDKRYTFSDFHARVRMADGSMEDRPTEYFLAIVNRTADYLARLIERVEKEDAWGRLIRSEDIDDIVEAESREGEWYFAEMMLADAEEETRKIRGERIKNRESGKKANRLRKAPGRDSR